jgi:hypothetical protein
MNIFRSKPTTVLYLRRQDAVLITKGASVRLEISTDFMQNLEVVESTKLTELVAAFFEGHHIQRQTVLLVLDDGLVFRKSFAAEDGVAAKEFESKIPFDPANRQVVTMSQKNQHLLLGTNRALYQAVAQGIRKANKLKGVVPASVYGVHESSKVDRQAINAFFTNGAPLRQANFLAKA